MYQKYKETQLYKGVDIKIGLNLQSTIHRPSSPFLNFGTVVGIINVYEADQKISKYNL